MRVHVVAPKLADIDLVALTRLKKHINIRISTNFDLNNPEDQMRLKQVEGNPNVSVRHFPRENLWSINKDFEEVVVCVLSKSDTGELQIAGMDSVLEEHVKLFAAVLEDVWIQSKKFDQVEITQAIKRAPGPAVPQPQYQRPITPPTPKVSQPLPPKPEPIRTPPAPEPIKPTPVIQPGMDLSVDANLSHQFDNIVGKIDTLPGEEIALLLEKLQDDLLEQKGFSAILRQIRMGITPLKSNRNILSNTEKDELRSKIRFWRSKLNL